MIEVRCQISGCMVYPPVIDDREEPAVVIRARQVSLTLELIGPPEHGRSIDDLMQATGGKCRLFIEEESDLSERLGPEFAAALTDPVPLYPSNCSLAGFVEAGTMTISQANKMWTGVMGEAAPIEPEDEKAATERFFFGTGPGSG